MSDLSFGMATLGSLSTEEQAVASKLIEMLDAKTPRNLLKQAYYDGKKRVRDLGIAIPPEMKSVETIVGWPGTAVDALDERLDWEGVSLPDADVAEYGLDTIIRDNHMVNESGLGTLDSLIFGVSFLAVGTGADGEPDPLITTESPLHTTALWDARSRRLVAGLTRVWDPTLQRTTSFALYLPDVTIRCRRSALVDRWIVEDRDEHNMGRVMLARIVNRPRAGNRHGRSEITRAVRSITDTAVRTMLGMEVSREFYSSPQRYILGADEKAFQGPDGKPKTAWESYLGRWLALTADGDGDKLQVGQFTASSPAPFIEYVKMLSQMLSAETAIPPTQLGFVSDNPPSADSVRMLESRLVKRAERRQTGLGEGRCEALRLAVLNRDGEIPPALNDLVSRWRDPSTPTRSAAADEVTKLVTAGILPAQSEVTWKRLGFSAQDIAQLKADLAAGGALEDLMRELAGAQEPPA